MKESGNDVSNEQNTDQKNSLKVWRLFLLAGLWLLIAVSLGFMGFGFFGIGMVSFYGIVKLSGYCRKRYQVSLLPQEFTTKISQSEIVQVFFVRARTRVSSVILYFVTLVSLVMLFGAFRSLLIPVLDLEQMDKCTGIVEKVIQRPRTGARRSCGDRLYIRSLDGGMIDNYYGRFDSELLTKLKRKKGSIVTVWSQIEYRHPPCSKKNQVWQIEQGGNVIKTYNKRRREWFYGLEIKSLVISFIVCVLSMARIWAVHHKK